MITSNTITEGFTRLIYISNGDSRLNYNWYVSNDKVVEVSSYGTLLGLKTTENTTIKVMAVNKANPSTVYIKEYCVVKEEKDREESPIEYKLEYTIGREEKEISIDLSTIDVPINKYGKIFIKNVSFGVEYLITGQYTLNQRVTVYINLKIVQKGLLLL